MRISTNSMYNQGINRLSGIQNKMLSLQEQISTQKKFNSPSEDPIGAARALEIEYAMKVNQTYADTRISAKNSLNLVVTKLDNAQDLIKSAQSILVGAGNGTLSDLERGFKAQELKNIRDALLATANAQDASGKYVFSGFKTDTKPFDTSVVTPTYQGGADELKLNVDSNRQMAVNSRGDSVFQPSGGTDVFDTLQDIIDLLNTPITNDTQQAAFNTGLTTAIGNMKGALNNVLNEQSSIGAKLKELDQLDIAGDAMELQYKTTLSEVQDLDLAEALSDVAKYQVILEAAQKTFTASTKLSLFDFM